MLIPWCPCRDAAMPQCRDASMPRCLYWKPTKLLPGENDGSEAPEADRVRISPVRPECWQTYIEARALAGLYSSQSAGEVDLNWQTPGRVTHWFWLGFSDLYCDFLGFICSYFDLILLALVPLLVGFLGWIDLYSRGSTCCFLSYTLMSTCLALPIYLYCLINT
jgi:hypothetical protein